MLKKYIPSLVTLLNLMAGFLAILLADPEISLALILIACIFDIFDGILARLLHATSEFGKQLDSLADIATFGIAPAFIVYHFCLPENILNAVIVSLIPLFSAVRLAKFNLDANQKYSFSGLPTPANGLFFASLPFVNQSGSFLLSELIIFLLIIIFSILMIAPVRMFSFKNIRKKGKDTWIPLIFIAIIVLASCWLGWSVVPFGVILYILLSFVYHFSFKHTKTKYNAHNME